VGDAKLTYAGYSYGSYLGATYANLFPGKVRALIVDGVLDPVAWSTGRGDQARTLPFSTRLRSAKGAYETLQEFLRLCDAGGPNCAFSEGNPARRFDRLAKRLLREPVEFTDPESGETILVTYAELIGTTLGVLYDPFVWPEWAGILQQLYELTSPGAAAASLQAVRARLGAAFQQEDYPNFVEGFPGVACSETDNPSNVGAWSRAARARTASSPTSAGPGPGSPASASPGRARTTTATPAPGTAPPPTRCWWSAPGSTRRPLPRGGHRRPAPAALAAAHPGRLGAHLAVQLRLHRRPCQHLLPDHTGTGEGDGVRPGRGAVRRAGRDRPGPAGHRGVQQERPDPADAPADADRLSDRRRCPSQGVG
jgi:pimeloyl-ACP methyl ester carboxylesterase